MLKRAGKYDPDADLVLYFGDCLDLLATMPDHSVKLTVTSPPYNIGKEYEKKTSLSEYLLFQKAVIEECIRVTSLDGSICWQVGNYIENGEIVPLDMELYPIFKENGLQLRNRIIWHFGHGLHASKRFSGRYEVILWFTRTNNYTFNLDDVRIPQKYPGKKHFKGPHVGELSCNPIGKNPEDVWNIPNVKSNHIEKTAHPAQFPVELIERLILAFTNNGDTVFDPFMGSGTTQIASLLHNRKSIGAELFEDYYQIAQDRIDRAERGELKIRPMERPVYDPTQKVSLPPKTVQIGQDQQLTIKV